MGDSSHREVSVRATVTPDARSRHLADLATDRINAGLRELVRQTAWLYGADKEPAC